MEHHEYNNVVHKVLANGDIKTYTYKKAYVVKKNISRRMITEKIKNIDDKDKLIRINNFIDSLNIE